MRCIYLSLILVCLSFAAAAQQPDLSKSALVNKRFYIGINATTIGYNLDYKQQPKEGDIRTYGSVNLGYRLGKRMRVQLGASYSTDEWDRSNIYVEADDKLVYYNDISQTRGVSFPISSDYVLLFPFKKLQFYGTAMLTPIISTTKQEKSEGRGGVTTVTYSAKSSGMNTYLTAGFGLYYPISSRFDVYGNYYLISRSFNKGLRPKDEYPYPGSFTIGLNYNLNLKR